MLAVPIHSNYSNAIRMCLAGWTLGSMKGEQIVIMHTLKCKTFMHTQNVLKKTNTEIGYIKTVEVTMLSPFALETEWIL